MLMGYADPGIELWEMRFALHPAHHDKTGAGLREIWQPRQKAKGLETLDTGTQPLTHSLIADSIAAAVSGTAYSPLLWQCRIQGDQDCVTHSRAHGPKSPRIAM